jgi:acetate CoA/acetoacetate CoA-transferase beta subunit
MDEKTVIAKRVALELRDGELVNLGIGLPTLVARYLPDGVEVFLQSENGLIGVQALPDVGLEDDDLTDAGGGPIGAIPGAAAFDSAMSFGLVRGGHLDVTVLGGLQVDQQGQLANWMVPGKMVPGMGGAMDLVSGAKRVIVAMQHTAKGQSKILKRCTLPVTSVRRVDLIVTDLAVIEPTPDGLLLRETAPGVAVEEVIVATEAELIIPVYVPTMPIDMDLGSKVADVVPLPSTPPGGAR